MLMSFTVPIKKNPGCYLTGCEKITKSRESIFSWDYSFKKQVSEGLFVIFADFQIVNQPNQLYL